MKNICVTLILVAFTFQGYTSAQSNAAEPQETKGQQVQEKSRKINLYDRKKRRHGMWEFYWEDDTTALANKGEFRHGNQVGTWHYYNQDGSLQKIETKVRIGNRYKTQIFYPNGKLQKEGYARLKKTKEYLNYYWYGEWKCYDEQGHFVKTERYKQGELVE